MLYAEVKKVVVNEYGFKWKKALHYHESTTLLDEWAVQWTSTAQQRRWGEHNFLGSQYASPRLAPYTTAQELHIMNALLYHWESCVNPVSRNSCADNPTCVMDSFFDRPVRDKQIRRPGCTYFLTWSEALVPDRRSFVSCTWNPTRNGREITSLCCNQ